MMVSTSLFADLSALALCRNSSYWISTVLLFVVAITFVIWMFRLALQGHRLGPMTLIHCTM
jgi:hypothetical protein